MIESFIDFFKKPSISYGITVCNEKKELVELLEALFPWVDDDDEVIVLQDITNEYREITEVLKNYEKRIIHIQNKLNGDFASFKNNLIHTASKAYLFQIDADEIPQEGLMRNLKSILKKEYRSNVFLVPRINIVNGIKQEHIEAWHWKIDSFGYVNFPDYQPRILKLNKNIKWENKVHEVLTGTKKNYHIPAKHELSLLHRKKIERQEEQNEFYDNL